MGKHFALTLQLPSYKKELNRNKTAYSANNQQIGVAIFIASLALILIYLIQVNSFSTKGYEIRRLQKQISEQKDNYQKLETEAAELQSIQRIQGDQKVLNMVPVDNVSFIQTTSLSQR